LGIFVPARTPADVVDRLNGSVRAALTTSDVKAGLSNLSLDITGSTPAEFARLIKSDTERWASIVRASGFRPED
jgi:tripartite-type tricarboxylate transporter receptor subunit TctC